MGKAETASRNKNVSGAADSGESRVGGTRAVSFSLLAVLLALAASCGRLIPVFAQQAAHYRKHGPALLNDPQITPGVVALHDKKQVCETKWGETPRAITPKMKAQACIAYGLKPHCYGRDTNEIDHLISKELGGADDARNIWPQPYDQHPGAHEKDAVENYLHKQVCDGGKDLAEAQKEIAADWYAVYLRMQSAQPKKSDYHLPDPNWVQSAGGK